MDSMFIAGNKEEVGELGEMGVDIIVCGSNYGFLNAGSKEALEQLERA